MSTVWGLKKVPSFHMGQADFPAGQSERCYHCYWKFQGGDSKAKIGNPTEMEERISNTKTYWVRSIDIFWNNIFQKRELIIQLLSL